MIYFSKYPKLKKEQIFFWFGFGGGGGGARVR